MALPFALGASAVLAAAALLPAHGGQYRGPGVPLVAPPGGTIPGGPGGPTTGGSAPAGTPTSGASPTIAEEASWQVWWELNKDAFVQQDVAGHNGPATGSDDYYLGQRKRGSVADTLMPTDVDLRDRVVPALVALIEKDRNRDVQTACLMALGKIGIDAPGIDLEKVISSRIARDDQEVRETAVLALGVAGRRKALPILLAIASNETEGRRLVERDNVSERTRAFAAYSLGVLALHSDDVDTKQQIHDAMWAILRDKEIKNRDVRTAAVNALGLLVDASQTAHKRIAWLTVDELLEWYQQDHGRGNETIQAQAPIAIGRLLGRGTSQVHQRCKQHFAGVLLASVHRSNAILQSAAIALGMLAVPSPTNNEDAAVEKALQIYFEKGVDRQARSFAIMSMGRIGGDANRAWLADAYRRANKTSERPWISLALGLIGATDRAAGHPDDDIARVLLDDIATTLKPDVQGAMAIAIGLTGYPEAVATMKRLLHDNEHQETLAGYFSVGLAMLGDQTAVATLSEILERSKRRPFLLVQAAVGLGRLGDRTANERLIAMMKETESVAVLSALANAVGQIGDRRAIDPLIEMTKNDELTKLARAFCAAALGGVGDRSAVPWNMPLSRDSNYAAPVDTLSNGATGVLDIL
jgi:HEAT repeat protein